MSFAKIQNRAFTFSNRIRLPGLDYAQAIQENLQSIIANGIKRGRPFPIEQFNQLTQPSSNQPESQQSLHQDKESHKQLQQLFFSLPNTTAPDVPEGETQILKHFGAFERELTLHPPGTNHVDVGVQMGLFDFEAASSVVGSKWVYLKGQGALLENALVQFALDKLLRRGFELVLPPDVADIQLVAACGFQPKDREGEVYRLADSTLALAATSEILLAGLYAGRKIPKHQLPKRFVALSHCFRPEVGHYGSSARGLFRVHQFTKVEMFSYCLPQDSESIFEEFVALQQEIIQELELYGRLVAISAKELGNSAYRKRDVEVWFPMRRQWGEVTSASDCTTYQTSRLGIYSIDSSNGKKLDLHTVNATALAVPRVIQALVENWTEIGPEGKWKFKQLPKALNRFFIGR